VNKISQATFSHESKHPRIILSTQLVATCFVVLTIVDIFIEGCAADGSQMTCEYDIVWIYRDKV
jgi:hypothetical protein